MYFSLILFLLVLLGSYLLMHLGAGTVPKHFRPLAAYWVRSGHRAASFNRFLWVAFVLVAGAFFAPVLGSLFDAAVTLGTVR